AIVSRWSAAAADARFLVTTREPLGLPEERVVAVEPLDEPAAVTLFAERARAASASFRLAAEDRGVVGALVRGLDGLPVAMELAAARVRVLPPRGILERMSDRFRLLADRGRRQRRHETLQAALDWSWELLPDGERAALAQAGVFEGAFTLEDADHVLDL